MSSSRIFISEDSSTSGLAQRLLEIPDCPSLPQEHIPGTAAVEILHMIGSHDKWINGLCFSPDGRLMASGSDGTIHLWEVLTGEHQQMLVDRDGRVESLAFAPNGKFLASLSTFTVKIWDIVSGTLQQTLTGGKLGNQCLAISPNSRLVASGAGDKTVRIWDAQSGDLRHILSADGDGVHSVAFSPDGKLIASGWSLGEIRIWDVVSGDVKQILREYSDRITLVTFSPNGKLVASCTYDGTIRVWSVEVGKVQQLYRSRSWLGTLSFSHSGSHLLSEYGPELLIRRESADNEPLGEVCWPLWITLPRYRLNPNRSWVTFSGHRIRCLPLENDFVAAAIWQHAPPSTAAYVALGYRSGKVALIYFSDFGPSSPTTIWALPQIALVDPKYTHCDRKDITEFLGLAR